MNGVNRAPYCDPSFWRGPCNWCWAALLLCWKADFFSPEREVESSAALDSVHDFWQTPYIFPSVWCWSHGGESHQHKSEACRVRENTKNIRLQRPTLTFLLLSRSCPCANYRQSCLSKECLTHVDPLPARSMKAAYVEYYGLVYLLVQESEENVNKLLRRHAKNVGIHNLPLSHVCLMTTLVFIVIAGSKPAAMTGPTSADRGLKDTSWDLEENKDEEKKRSGGEAKSKDLVASPEKRTMGSEDWHFWMENHRDHCADLVRSSVS